MNAPPALKKPKAEFQESNAAVEAPTAIAIVNGGEEQQLFRHEQEEALVALIEHRTKEVEHLRQRINYYKTQLDMAEKRLDETQTKLARLRGQDNIASSKHSVEDSVEEIKVERRSISPVQISDDSSQGQSQGKSSLGLAKSSKLSGCGVRDVKLETSSASPARLCGDSSQSQHQSRPQLLIPATNPKTSQPFKMDGSSIEQSNDSGGRSNTASTAHVTSTLVKVKKERPPSLKTSSDLEAGEKQAKGTKRKIVKNEHRDLIPLISSRSSPCTISCQRSCAISSQHKRKVRSLALCPTNIQLFMTSALDGIVNLWQIQGRGLSANLLSATPCASAKHRRWPEDVAWHPDGNSLFSVYSADGGDSQISILDLNKAKGATRVSFLDEKPHIKGIINSILFMPWEDPCFVTGGSDHAAILWTEKDGEKGWKPKALHRSMHSSAVMGVAGMLQKQIVISVGADKRIIGFDVLAGRAEYKHQIESKCMSVLPNPCDFNLFMVQTGTPERQLRLFDLRLRQTEIHAFGWKQESSESQSALINQAWSPDGLYLTSGSADPMIHLFDIRYNSRRPSQSMKAHDKRVFKAVWHSSFPLLISISSDLNIEFHRVT